MKLVDTIQTVGRRPSLDVAISPCRFVDDVDITRLLSENVSMFLLSEAQCARVSAPRLAALGAVIDKIAV